MSRGRWAAVVSALPIAVVAAVTAGCGGGGGALALDPVAAAATKTQQAGAARVRFTLAFNGAKTNGKTVRISGAGAVDGTSSKLTLRMGSLFRQLGVPAGATSTLTPAQLMHAKLTEIALEQNGDYVLYVGSSLLSKQLPGGQHWVEVNLSKLGKAAGVDLGSLLSGSQFQPGDVLSMLEAEGAKVRSVGPATVRGVATTHYRVKLDVAKALQAKGLNNPLLTTAAAEMPNIPLDVWIARDGLVHRVRAAFAQTQNGAPARASLTMDVFDYGAHVTITAPPSGDVFDATQLAQSFGSLSH